MARRGSAAIAFAGAILLSALPPGGAFAASPSGGIATAKEQRSGISLPEGGLRLILLPEGSPVRTLALDGRTIRVYPWRNGSGPPVEAALVGVDFAQKAGPLSLVFQAQDGSDTRLLLVLPRPFQVSRLHVARSFVTPPHSFLLRIARERAVIIRALSPPDAPLRFNRPFILPLSGRLTHDFGAYRYLNGHPMARHSGEDIDASMGTPVRASNDGVVRLAGPFYYDGNMVIIDHGGGLLTEYLHMADMRVRAGEVVHRGEVIGHVGHSGRVTGPVLHYGAVLHGWHVNPLLLAGLLERPLVVHPALVRKDPSVDR